MYRALGNQVIRFWPVLVGAWILTAAALWWSAPPLHEVTDQGEFAFLPEDSPSLKGEAIYREAWGDSYASNVVVVVRRRTALDDVDRDFIQSILKPRIQEIIDSVGLPSAPDSQAEEPASDADGGDEELQPVEDQIKTFASESGSWKKILDSADGTATMVVIELGTEFLNAANSELIDRIEVLISEDGLYKETIDTENDETQPVVPPGLKLALSGSATVGRDLLRASAESAEATELWTAILVIALLALIYRAPLLAIIPLATVAIATDMTLSLLALLAQANVVGLFHDIEVYVRVLCFGAGVDYCLFLIARFKEELDSGEGTADSVSNAIAKVGDALVASAGTVMCGIGMMVFADFGKFRQAGVAITIGLAIVLLAALTFTPALLRMTGRWVFWPHIASRKVQTTGGWVSATGLMASLLRRNVFDLVWQRTGDLIRRRPGFVLTTSFVAMLPFAIISICCFGLLSYGLLSELPQDNASVQGAKAIQKHYPSGIAGPVTILLHNDEVDFREEEGKEAIGHIAESLFARSDELRLADIRSVKHPFGVSFADEQEPEEQTEASNPLTRIFNDVDPRRRIVEFLVNQRYVGQRGDYDGQITRLDFLSVDDPFSRNGIKQLAQLKQAVQVAAQKELPATTRLYAIGPTPSIQDLKATTDRDQIVVDSLVLIGVFLILLVLLRQLTVSIYLIVSVFFSYLVTLGVAYAVFWIMDPSGFAGLDWKVPTFLFTILIAIGEDYNIFLMTRIREEQVEHGAVQGVIVALTKTGSIISSCGIIMAGTFASLLAGTLVGMHQLGFALAFGVLLDTFVVRPILVPAFLVLLYEGRFQPLAQLAGVLAPAAVTSDSATADSATEAAVTDQLSTSPESEKKPSPTVEPLPGVDPLPAATEPLADIPTPVASDEAESVNSPGDS